MISPASVSGAGVSVRGDKEVNGGGKLIFECIDTDLLVIGSGLAGLRAAVAAAEKGVSVLVVSKGTSASPEIMGFNAPVVPEDSEEQYYQDMERSGYGINDSRLARVLTENVLGEVNWLEEHGVHFTRDREGRYAPIHTLGTKYPRLIRAGISSGATEMKMMGQLCSDLGIMIDVHTDVLGLLAEENHALGAWGLRGGKPVCYQAKAVILATGGCGAIQNFSTYPPAIIGDGYAMAYEVGAGLVDMEFQQFEPCCFIWPEQIRGKVIATTLLRHGAELRNGLGETFMANYGLSRENAQKGPLSRAMLAEVQAGRGSPHGGILYDMTMFDADFLYKDHAIFTRPAQEVGIDLTKEMPEMMPAAHTNLGGVIIDTSCMSEVDGLFACGEVIGGLHGGNRLGGSAGAETVVFGHLAGESAADYILRGQSKTDGSMINKTASRAFGIIDTLIGRKQPDRTSEIRKRLGVCLQNNLGIIRSAETVRSAEEEVQTLCNILHECGAKNLDEAAEHVHCQHMLKIAQMQIRASALRQESRGVFFRSDYPEQDDTGWKRNIIIRRDGDSLKLSTRPAVKDPFAVRSPREEEIV